MYNYSILFEINWFVHSPYCNFFYCFLLFLIYCLCCVILFVTCLERNFFFLLFFLCLLPVLHYPLCNIFGKQFMICIFNAEPAYNIILNIDYPPPPQKPKKKKKKAQKFAYVINSPSFSHLLYLPRYWLFTLCLGLQ